jgi:glycerol uptake facilitator-like aquaporin
VIRVVDRVLGGLTTREAAGYVLAQIAGGVVGALVANLMFSLDVVSLSTKARTGGGSWLAEVVATLGLSLVVFGVVRSGRTGAALFAVGAYIAAAYFFTSSTSFANPAATLGRTLSNTFAGIAPASALMFIGAQVVGGVIAIGAIRVLYPDVETVARQAVLPRDELGDRG